MLYAFFDRDERLDPGAMRRQVEALIRRGVHGISVLRLAMSERLARQLGRL